MSNDKMREEFEATYIGYCESIGAKPCTGFHMLSEIYVNEFVEMAWKIYQSSRESMSLFRSRKDLIIKVFNGGDDDDAYIFAVNGEIVVDRLAEIEDELKDEHEFSQGPGEYTYSAAYDDGQYDEFGNCEFKPFWELTEIAFEKPEWMSMSHEPQKFQFKDEPCPKCGIYDISCLC